MDGLPDELEQQLQRDGAGLRRLALGLVGESGADDLVQDGWLAWLRRAPSIERPGAWLRGALPRLAWKRAASAAARRDRETARARAAQPSGEPDPAELLERSERLQRLIAELRALEPHYAQALWLVYFEQLAPRELAQRLGVPEATVRTRVRRALEQMRARLDRGAGGRGAWCAGLIGSLGLARELRVAAGPASAAGASAPALGGTAAVTAGIGGIAMGTKGLAWVGGLALAAALIAWAWNRAPHEPAAPLQAPIARASDAELASAAPAETAPSQELAAREGVASAAPIAVELAPTAAAEELLHGIVVDWLDRPVEGAQIRGEIADDWQASPPLALSDALGNFRCAQAAGGWLYARAAGFAPSVALYVSAGLATRTLKIVLPGPGGELNGQIVDPNGAAVAGAIVRVGPGSNTMVPSPQGALTMGVAGLWVRSDASGRFHADGIAYGKASVRVHRAGLARWRGQVEIGRDAAELRIELQAGARVAGVVRDTAGRALEHAQLRIEAAWDFPFTGEQSKADGSYELLDLPAGSHEFIAEHESHPELHAQLELVAGGELRWDPILAGTRRITGRVLGGGVASFDSWWLDWDFPSGAGGGRVPLAPDGRFEFELKETGASALSFSVSPPREGGGRGGEIAQTWPGVALAPEPIELRLPTGWDALGSVTGSLRIAEDDPARGAHPVLFRVDEHNRIVSGVGGLSASLDAHSGAFRFERVRAARYALVLPCGNFDLQTLRSFELAPGEQLELGEVALPAQGTLHAALTIDAAPPPRPLTCCILSAEGEEPPRSFGQYDQGLPEEIRLRAGSYRLWLIGNGQCFSRWVPFEVRADRETRLEIDLVSRRALLVRVRPKAGVEVPGEIALSVQTLDLLGEELQQPAVELRVPRVGSVYEISIEVRPASYRLRVEAGSLGSLDRKHNAYHDELPELELQLE